VVCFPERMGTCFLYTLGNVWCILKSYIVFFVIYKSLVRQILEGELDGAWA
jgi:hypothetical protein